MSHYTAERARVIGSPELKFTPSGTAVCDLRVAVNHSKKTPSGEWQDIGTTWITVSLFGKDAEIAASEINDKDLVMITGDLITEDWQKQDGTKGSSLKLRYATVAKRTAYKNAPIVSQPAASQASMWDAPTESPF